MSESLRSFVHTGDELERGLQQALKTLLYAVAMGYLFFVGVGVLRVMDGGTRGTATLVLGFDLANLIAIGGVLVWLSRGQRGANSVHTFAGVIGVLVVGNATGSALIFQSLHELYFIVFLPLCGAGVLLSRRLVLTFCLGSFAVVGPMAYSLGGMEGSFGLMTVQLISALLSLMIFEGRMRLLRRLEDYQRDEHEQRQAAAADAEEAKEALARRKRVEAEKASLEAERASLEAERHALRRAGASEDRNRDSSAKALYALTYLTQGWAASALLNAQPSDELETGFALLRAATVGRAVRGFQESSTLDSLLDEAIDEVRRSAPSAVEVRRGALETGTRVTLRSNLRDSFRHSIVHLLTNAVEACGEEGEVSISRQEIDGNPSHIVVQIWDNGCGMEPELLANARRPFTTTKGVEHFGLGLTLADRFASEVGGELRLESREPQGMLVELSMKIDELQPPQDSSSSETEGSGKVLVVDDEELVRRTLVRSLKLIGFEGMPAATAEEAMDLLADAELAAIVVDLHMPGTSGRECVEMIREVEPDLPIVLVSGYPRAGEAERLIEEGLADAFARKPFSRLELQSAIQHALENRAKRPMGRT